MHHSKVCKVLFENIKHYLPKQIITISPVRLLPSQVCWHHHTYSLLQHAALNEHSGKDKTTTTTNKQPNKQTKKKRKKTHQNHQSSSLKNSDSPRHLRWNEGRGTVTGSFARGCEDARTPSNKKDVIRVQVCAKASSSAATQLQTEILHELC